MDPPAPFDFHGWNKEQIEKGIAEMGCENPSVGALPLLTKAALLYSDEESARPTSKECLKSLQSTKYQLFNDPIHGSVELHPLLAKIVKMRVFTRLKNIRQLGGVYYVYPGATHTRFEHSIGTCYIAGEFIRMLQRKQPELHISDKEALCVEIAALCHDLGHGPFSHLFEKDVVKPLKKDPSLKDLDFPKHEKLSTMVFEHHVYKKEKELFNGYGIGDGELEFIKKLIDHDLSKLKNKKRRFLYEIVANKCTGIDVDKWDYFARDCHYMGILTEFDWRRLMAVSRVIKVAETGEYRICYRDKEVNNIYGMFRTRCSLHQKAYQHKSVIAAEHMIALAILKVKDMELIMPWPDADDEKIVRSKPEVESEPQTPVQISVVPALTRSPPKPEAESEPQTPVQVSVVPALKEVTRSPPKPEEESEPQTSVQVSVVSALKEVTKSPPNLNAYLALNDSIVHLILNCPAGSSTALQEAQTLLRHLDQREMFQKIIVESDSESFSVSEDVILKHDTATNPGDKLTLDDLYIRPVQISYASEKNEDGQMDDPVKQSYFYTKEEPWKAIPYANYHVKKSGLVLPTKFVLAETRLYCSPGPTKRKQASEAYENAKKLKTTDVDSNQLTSASGSEPSSNNMMMTPARQGNDEGAN